VEGDDKNFGDDPISIECRQADRSVAIGRGER